MACCILTAVIMNQLIKICDAFDISIFQIKYNDDDEERGACAPASIKRDTGSKSCHIAIIGMTCGACASSIVQRLEELDGVDRAGVSLAIGRATVSYRASVIALETVIEAVREMGYAASAGEDVSKTLAHLNQSSELLGLKQALSSASICSSLILVLEYLQLSVGSSVSSSCLKRVSTYAALLLAAKVQVLDIWPIHAQAWSRPGRRKLTMETLLSLSLLLGMGLALLQSCVGRKRESLAYASSGSFLTIVILAGKYLEAVFRKESNRNLAALYELQAEREVYRLADTDVSRSRGKRNDYADHQTGLRANLVAEEGRRSIHTPICYYTLRLLHNRRQLCNERIEHHRRVTSCREDCR